MSREGRARAALKADDSDAAWSEVGLRHAPAETLARLLRRVNGNHGRQKSLLSEYRRRLADPDQSQSVVPDLWAFLDAYPGAKAVYAVLLQSGHIDRGRRRRALLVGGAPPPQMDHAIIRSLVADGDAQWLLDQVTEGTLRAPDLTDAIVSIICRQPNAEAMTIRVARASDDLDLLRAVLRHAEAPKDLVRRADASDACRLEVLEHLHRVHDRRATLRKALADSNPHVRRRALEALEETPDPKLDDLVKALVDDPDPYDDRHNPRPIATLARAIVGRNR